MTALLTVTAATNEGVEASVAPESNKHSHNYRVFHTNSVRRPRVSTTTKGSLLATLKKER
jgi:hypothetical protein